MASLDESFDFCRRLTRRTAGNFYFSFLTLPRPKRDAMCVVYAWMRLLDDLADNAPSPETSKIALEKWVKQTQAHLSAPSDKRIEEETWTEFVGSCPPGQIPLLWPAFVETARRHRIPTAYFDEIAQGALMDQTIRRYETFDDLYRYCYRVASLVGLVSLRVFEYQDPRAEKCGEWLGIAFQLTNILRDVPEDAARGRIYLPLEDLRAHGVKEEDVLQGRWSEPMRALLESFARRAESYYEKARPVTRLVSPQARPTLRIMTEIYHGILERTRAMDYRVFDHRARVPTWRKLLIVARHQMGALAGRDSNAE